MRLTSAALYHSIVSKGCGFVILLISVAVTICGCSIEREAQKKFARVGESATLNSDLRSVSNAIVLWAGTLTNGYTLSDDQEIRGNSLMLQDDAALLFVLQDEKDRDAPWDSSACLPPAKSSYWASIVIRLVPVSEATRVSVAIHGQHRAYGVFWNMHTFGFETVGIRELQPCAADEKKVLDCIRSALNSSLSEK